MSTQSAVYAILDKAFQRSEGNYKLRLVTKDDEGIHEVSRQRIDALNVDIFFSERKQKEYAQLRGVLTPDENQFYILSNL